MTYADALARLLASPTKPKLGLERMRELLARLGDPHKRVRTLHVAGTKGKGSTCAFAESICRRAGLRTGMTTSPHLCTARERIAIDGAMIAEDAFAALESRVFDACATDPALDASFFERTIAMAWLHFVEARVDVAVVEVGLGGRLDATNVCEPAACAVTRLGLDHTDWLGPTLVDIAREKAGILKRGVPAVSPPQRPEARAVLEDTARAVETSLAFVDVDPALSPSLAGDHQRENATVAAALVRAARISVSDELVRAAVSSTIWPGRYETVATDPLVVVDGAHNEDAAGALAETLAKDPRFDAGVIALVGMTKGHDPVAFARALLGGLPRERKVTLVATDFASKRALGYGYVMRAFSDVFAARKLVLPGATLPVGFEHAGGILTASTAPSLEVGVDEARSLAQKWGAAVIATGSLYLVGEVRHRLLGVPMDPAFPLF